MPLLTTLKHVTSTASASSAEGAIVLSASRSTAEEGDSVNFYLSVPISPFPAGTLFPYTITGITQDDLFYGSLTGNFTIDANGYAQASIILARDSLTEVETLTLTLDGAYSTYSVTVTITDTSAAPVGESVYTVPGTYSWTCPAGVTSVSAVAIGGGGGGTIWYGGTQGGSGGGGGGLGYKNNIAVTPGNTYTVVVGAGGASYSGAGGNSYFITTTTVRGGGGGGGINQYGSGDVSGGAGGTFNGDGGGSGGTGIVMDVTYKTGQCGGGSGAGGYGGTGGYGGGSTTTVSDFTKRAGGNGFYSGAGGGFFGGSASVVGRAGAGGGTGLYGTESSGVTTGGAWASSGVGGNGQQYGPQLWTSLKDGQNQTIVANQQRYGGGAPARNDNGASRGSSGAVRLMWGGGRSFPSNATYMAPPTGVTITQTQILANPNPATSSPPGDNFGYSVAMDGKYAIIGAYGDNDTNTASGKAYIFDVTNGQLVHTLTNPNAFDTSASDYFGYSVAMSGNYCIVGAYREDDSTGTDSGKAYIFNVTTGELAHTLDNPNPVSTSQVDYFGWAVAIFGNYAVVGAPQEEETGSSNSGKAYIYNVNTGILLDTLDNPNVYNTSASDKFGESVAMFGDYVIIGAPYEDELNGTNSGKVYIFDVATGTLVYTLNNPNSDSSADYDNFGYSVAISGNYAVVGAIGESNYAGRAYVFDLTNGNLIQGFSNPSSPAVNDEFGHSVAISGEYCIIGAPYTYTDPVNSVGNNAGKVYIFNITTGLLVQTIDNPDSYTPVISDKFGTSVGVSGNYFIGGAPGEGTSSPGAGTTGTAYLYRLSQN